MSFAEALPQAGQTIRIKWGEGDWIDFGTLTFINEAGQVPNESWHLTSDRYQNSVVRYYDLWEIKT